MEVELPHQAFKRREKLPFLEPDMRGQALAEVIQRPGFALSQAVEQCTQLPVFCQGALFERLVFRVVQERQQRLLLNLKMRLQFIGKCPDRALAGLSYPPAFLRLRRPLAGLCQGKGGVMLAR